MKKILIALITTLLFGNHLMAQANTNSDISIARKNAISLSFLGSSPLAGFTYERIIGPRSSFEIGAGLVSAGAGIHYYFSEIQNKKLLFNIGITSIVSPFFGDCEFCFGGKGFALYIPFGISYYQNALNLSLDIGRGSSFDSSPNAFLWYGNLKVGVRF